MAIISVVQKPSFGATKTLFRYVRSFEYSIFPLGNNRYVVYMSNALPTANLVQLVSPSNSQADYTIKMSDMVKGIDNLFATVKSQVRTVQGTYTLS